MIVNDFLSAVVVFIQVALTSPQTWVDDHVGHDYDVGNQMLCLFWE